jgi:hypothetical protein
MNTFNELLGSNDSWGYSVIDGQRILDIEASEETINALLENFKDVTEVI